MSMTQPNPFAQSEKDGCGIFNKVGSWKSRLQQKSINLNFMHINTASMTNQARFDVQDSVLNCQFFCVIKFLVNRYKYLKLY